MIDVGDPSEDAAVATIIFLLDGKLVLLRPSAKNEVPGTDLKYDMRVLSDKVEYFMLLSNPEHNVPTLRGSIWAWDGKNLKVDSFLLDDNIVDLDISSPSQSAWRCANTHTPRFLPFDHYSEVWYHCRTRIAGS
jgi:hypothetical protein